ncbi:MAG: hypothetical protein Aurels2KO_40570 [Aureliella sp.]
MLLEAARFTRNPRSRIAYFDFLREHTGQRIGNDLSAWYEWLWSQETDAHPHYAQYKQKLYTRVDPRFAEYFSDDRASTIRLDEIRWGGVRRDGIPPLKNPEVTSAAEALYLADSDIVFGVEFNGHARAYPKRILAWHEMVKDTVGGQSINGVYCTLCGSMIVYDTNIDGKHYELGTSGFLYRSNKLMYDHETKSMWSTLAGEPVVGPLVGKGLQLDPLYVVTTTWGQWKKMHPSTDVLTLGTGHSRDYGEGVAYRAYFATDRLMFTVPQIDTRLKNKDEVLALRGEEGERLAISAKFLEKHPVYHDSIGEADFVVLTDSSGANRVYDAAGVKFEAWENETTVRANNGQLFKVTEDALKQLDAAKTGDAAPTATPNKHRRLPAHRAFWFGWQSAYPDTELVK